MEIVQVTPADVDLVRRFLLAAGSSLVKFRYFDKRGLDVLSNHVVTLLAMSEDIEAPPCGYGHLDLAKDGTVWLGLCVAASHTGRGVGTALLDKLICEADARRLDVTLSVDEDNLPAIYVYEKAGFSRAGHTDGRFFYTRSSSCQTR